MTVNLHWSDELAPNVKRYGTFNTLHEALEQAVADDGMTAVRVTDESGDEIHASKAQIAEYADQKAKLEAKRDAQIAKLHEDHAAALANAAV
jgi:hypothetical protein